MTAYNSYLNEVLADSPWGYWRLGESSGTTAADASGNSRSGTISGSGVTYSQTGAIRGDTNTAFLFSSSAGTVTLPTSNPFTGTNAWSIELWMKVAALPGAGVFYNMLRLGNPSGGAGTSSTIYLTGNFSGEIAWDNQSASLLYTTPPSTNVYHHIVVTYAGGSSGAVILYVDGVSRVNTTATMSLPSSTAPVIAGNIAGDLDEVALYTTALSSTRVTAHYNAGLAITKSVGARTRLAVQVTKSVGARTRLAVQVTKSVGARLRLVTGTLATKTVGVRTRLAITATKVVGSRVRLAVTKTVSVGTRTRLGILVSKTVGSRIRLAVTATKSVGTRTRLAVKTSKTVGARIRLAIQITKTLGVRLRLLPTIVKTVGVRLRLSTTNLRTKSVGVRLNLLTGIASGKFTAWANGTGTASYDHFRVTEFPDPALCLAPITPRVGNTSILWNAQTPTNTTLGTDTSFDGVNWTDESSNDGGNIIGIFSQPDPTTDGFGSNTSANYTSTFRTGGGVSTWTYDTSNSRMIASGGTNGIYTYNAISRADIDFFADLDLSDAGGVVWRFVDQSNFYYLQINDSLSNTGTTNTATLYKVASNVRTQLGTAAITYNVPPTSNPYTVNFTRGTFRRFRVTMLSGAITCYVDGTQLLTYTDGSPLAAGKMGLFNNGGTSRYYQLWMVQIGDYVTGTPPFDIVTSKFVYTRQRLATTDPTETPQVSDITTLATTPEIGIGGVIPNVTYTAAFIDKNFDSLASASGNVLWYIDPATKRFNFHSTGSVASPWILQSAPAGLVNIVDLEVNNDLELDVSNDLYRNRMIILGAQGVTSTQTATFSGDGSTTSFTLGYPLASTPSSITLNGVAQTLAMKGSTGAQWYYALNDAVLQQDTSQTVLTSSDQLIVLYAGFFPETVTVDDTTEQAARALVEGGTGIVEAVEDHSSDVPPMTSDQAIAYAQSLINRYAIQGRTLIFDTSRNGLAVGQTLSIFLNEMGIWDGQFLITEVDITLMKAVGDQQIFWYKITASELPRQASWAKLLASGLGLQ